MGLIATTALAITATPKAITLLREAREEKGEELTRLESFKTAAPVYIPTAITGVTTLVCIFGANALNKHQQASLMSAYALLDNSFKQFREKVAEIYGKEAEKQIIAGIAKDNCKGKAPEEDDGKNLYYDFFSNRYFRATVETVQRAEQNINREISTRGVAYVNDLYKDLGIDPIKSGWDYIWTWPDCTWVDFDHEKTVTDDGLECHIITMHEEPKLAKTANHLMKGG